MKNISMKGKIVLSVISGLAFTALMYYFTLPAINPRSPSFWGSLIFVIASFAYPFLFKEGGTANTNKQSRKNNYGNIKFNFNGK